MGMNVLYAIYKNKISVLFMIIHLLAYKFLEINQMNCMPYTL